MKKYYVKRFFIVGALLIFFLFAVNTSFTQLMKPKDSLNSKTLYQIANNYEDDTSLKGNIYDCNGRTIMANVITDENGIPKRTADEYQFISELEISEQKKTAAERIITDESNEECWSNVLPVISGGLDYSFAGILQDIPLNEDDDTDIHLTIDSDVQSDVYNILSGRKYSSAIVTDCNTGNIVSMVSRPSYNYNTFKDGEIPYTSLGGANNTDNSHDCVQDYYNLWKYAYIEDNAEKTDISEYSEGADVRTLESNWTAYGMLLSEDSAFRQISEWNSAYNANLNLSDCMEVDFTEIFRSEKAFEQERQNGWEVFPFTYEPENLGAGTEYIPFVRLKTGGQVKYLKLFYGSNNFIYEDCVNNGFDPNFSFQNYALSNSAPGSCFKILMSALLIDRVNESMITDDGYMKDVSIANEYYGAEYTSPLPNLETSKYNHYTLSEALTESSNQYFSIVAIQLDDILKSNDSSYYCTYQHISELSAESIQNSGSILLNYYRDKFSINTDIDSYFDFSEARILSCLDSLKIADAPPQDGDLVYDDTLWYSLDEKGGIQQAYTGSAISLAQKIGDTSYGQGYDRISPLFMAMSMGKCLTGKMYVPNVLADESAEPEVIGEDFDRGDYTVQGISDCLKSVYDAHIYYVPDGLSFPLDAFTYYSKTGTSSVNKGQGTQSTYGKFAEKADYPIQTDSKDNTESYQIIWYVAGVSDGENCYSVVLRSYFDDDSYSLKSEFLEIVDSLCRCGYLNY